MEKVLAKVILQSVLSLDKGFNDLDPLVRDIKDPKKDDGCRCVLAPSRPS